MNGSGLIIPPFIQNRTQNGERNDVLGIELEHPSRSQFGFRRKPPIDVQLRGDDMARSEVRMARGAVLKQIEGLPDIALTTERVRQGRECEAFGVTLRPVDRLECPNLLVYAVGHTDSVG